MQKGKCIIGILSVLLMVRFIMYQSQFCLWQFPCCLYMIEIVQKRTGA